MSIAEMIARALLVVLFLPFSSLDKVLNFSQAVDQACAAVPVRVLSRMLIVTGFVLEIVCSAAVLTGVADRLATLLLSAYCIATALLWKQFWKAPDFRLKGPSKGREVFWDFLKNLSLAGAFALLAMSTIPGVKLATLAHELLSSTHASLVAGGS